VDPVLLEDHVVASMEPAPPDNIFVQFGVSGAELIKDDIESRVVCRRSAWKAAGDGVWHDRNYTGPSGRLGRGGGSAAKREAPRRRPRRF
jgi:hypothetical protein